MEGAGGSRSLDGCKTDKDERGVEVVSMKGNGGSMAVLRRLVLVIEMVWCSQQSAPGDALSEKW